VDVRVPIMDRGFFITLQAMRRQLTAMPCDYYQIRLIHGCEPYAVSCRPGLVRRATLSSSPPPYTAVKFRLTGTELNRGVWLVVTVSDTGIVMGGPESPNGVTVIVP
jgi:hypothetical protein